MKRSASGSDADYEGFVERLKVAVEIAGSVSALARQAGLSQPGLRRYLFGGDPSRRALRAIASGAGVSEDWLFSGNAPICAAGSRLAARAGKVAQDLAALGKPHPRWVTIVLQSSQARSEAGASAAPDPALIGELVMQLGVAATECSKHQSCLDSRLLERAVAATFDEMRADLMRRSRLPAANVLSAVLQAHLYRLGADLEE